MQPILREFLENPLTIIRGSVTGQLNSQSEENPLEPCPNTPNCIRYSHRFECDARLLFTKAETALKKTGAITVKSEPSELLLDAVYRIAVFGYLDDVRVCIETLGDDESILHIRSSSRTGYSDLGVNRRRIMKILQNLQQQF